MQIVAPRSIIAWLNDAARPAGHQRRGLVPSRAATRATLTSTAATCSSKANDATAAAVYGPTPGRARSPEAVPGHPSRATAPHASRRRSARRL